MLIILGFDGLDPYRVEEFGTKKLTLNYSTRLRVPDDIPLHTEVIWPTIITGRRPEEHGLTRTQARSFDNPLIQAAAWIGDTLFPRSLIMPIGRKIQELGFTRSERGNAQYYSSKNIDTIFTNTRSKVIGLPGYSPADETDEIRRMGGLSTHTPTVEIDVLIKTLENELEKRRIQVLDNLNLPVNILMVYSYATDMAGHIFWDDQTFIEEWYEKCEKYVESVLEEKSDDDEVLILSDHGMKEGKHRREAFFSSSWKPNPEPQNVLDVKSLIDKFLSDEKQGHEEVTDQMKGLGYI